MVNRIALHNAVGIIGNIVSFGLFVSPMPTFLQILKKKDVENFQPWPYVATVLNCMLWFFYGLPYIMPNSFILVTINCFGLFMEFIYLLLFILYCRQEKIGLNVVILLMVEITFMTALIGYVMLVIKKQTHRRLVVGIFCAIFNVIMYACPLLITKLVIKTKSVKYMPLHLSIANFANGIIWTIYSLIIIDHYVLISNGLGVLLGALQLILYGWFSLSYPQSLQGAIIKLTRIQPTNPRV